MEGRLLRVGCDKDTRFWMMRSLFLDLGIVGIYIKLGIGVVRVRDKLNFKLFFKYFIYIRIILSC